jgi:ubiquinone/menaquinone biosynthesis C-methylase UbiE
MDRDIWRHKAEDYERRLWYVVGPKCLEAALNAVSKEPKPGRAADFGCGTGLFTRPLALNAEHVVALDTSRAMLESASRKLKDLGNVQWVNASVLNTGLPSAELDTVLIANVLQVIKDRDRAMAEAARVLRPGGRLVLLAWTATGMGLWDRVTMVWRYLKSMGLPPSGAANVSPEEARQLVERSGFVVDGLEMLGSRVKCIHMRAHRPEENSG